MAEDEYEYVDLTGMENVASRLSVPAGKEAAELPGALPTSHRRRHSISPGTLGGKVVKGKARCAVKGPHTKALSSLLPFEHLLPPLDEMDLKVQEKLAAILHSTGAKAYLHLQRYYEALKATRSAGPNNPQPSSNVAYDEYGSHHVEDVAEALRGMADPASPDDVIAEVSAEMAAKALSMFAETCVRRPPTRSVEGMMAAAQDSQGAQSSEVDLRDAPDLGDEDDRQLSTPDHDSLFGLACAAGYTDLTEQLVRARGTTDFEGDFDCTPLMEACSAGNVDIVRILLKHGAHVDVMSATNNTALIYAAAAGHIECVRELLKTGKCNLELRNENGHCALMEAASAGHLKVVEELVRAGAQSVYMNANSEFKVGLESPLTLAAYKGHVQLVEYLLGLGGGSNRDEELHTALMEASMDGHVEVARKLLAHGAPVNLTSDSFESPLTLASCGGHAELVKILLDADAHIEEPNDESYTPLMEASREGHTEVVRILLERGAQVNAQTEETGETALTLSACGGFTDVVEILIKHGGELELGANTPLMEASQEGHMETVLLILEHAKKTQKIYSISFRTNINSAFSLACENGHVIVAQTLAQFGADLNYETDHRTPLMKACKQGYVDVVRFLLKRKADVNKRASNNEATALSLSCNAGHKEIVQLLLDMGADPNVVLKDGVTCVLEAAKNGHVAIVEMLLDCSGIPTVPTRKPLLPPNSAQHTRVRRPRKPGQTNPQQFPCPTVSTPTQMAKSVFHGGTTCNDSTSQMTPSSLMTTTLRTPSTLASTCLVGERDFQHHPSILNVFNQQGISNLDKMDGMIPSSTDIYTEFTDFMSPANTEQVSEQYADIMIKNEKVKRQAQLDAGIASKEEPNYEELWKQYKNYIHSTLLNPTATLDRFSFQIPTGIFPEIDSVLASIEIPDKKSTKYPFSIYESLKKNFTGLPVSRISMEAKAAERRDSSSAPKALLSTSQNVPSMNQNQTVMATALAERLLRNPVYEEELRQLNVSDRKNNEAVRKMCELALGGTIDDQHLEFFMQNPAVLENIKRHVLTAMCAINGKPIAVAPVPLSLQTNYLRRKSLSLSRRTKSESACTDPPTCMREMDIASPHYSPDDSFDNDEITRKLEHMVGENAKRAASLASASTPKDEIVDRVGGELNVDTQTESNHDTPLTLACSNGHTKMVELLLGRGANIEHRDKKGFTPLILAATGGHVHVVELLLAHKAQLEAQSERTKDTALSLACSGGRKEVVELLLKKGANKEHRNVSDYTPLSLAASGGYVEIVVMLLDAGAEINSRTGSKLGISPLMLAAMNGHKEATRILLERGSDINAQIETNRNTALTLACFQGRTEVVRLLLQYHANVEHRAKTGLTPLMEAANGGYSEVGELLLDAGADPNTTPVPSSRDTALTIAADKGHEKFVEMLVHRQSSIDAKNKKGCTALWLACNGGHYETVRILVEHAADVDAQDNRRVSSLMVAFRKGHSKVVKFMVNHVTQFPSDQELDRFIATITPTETELIAKCRDCKCEIVAAKEKQAKEAQKAAEALLQLLEEEEEQARSKKLTKQRQKEKKKAKKQAKKVEETKEDDSDYESKSKSEEPPIINNKEQSVEKQIIPTTVPQDRVPLMAIQQENSLIAVPVISGISNSERQKQRRQEKKETQRKRQESGRGVNSTTKLVVQTQPQASLIYVPKSPIAQTTTQSQEEWVKANSKKNKAKSATVRASSQSAASQLDKMKEYFTDRNGAYAGWKDVELSRRRAQALTVPSQAIARVIGRGGANINAIREATGASIEVEKQAARRDQLERQITIRGTSETVRYAVQMINGLIGDSEATVNDIVRQVLRGGNNSTASATSSDGGRPNFENKPISKMAAGATVSVNSAPAPPTNVWQQRIAARQQMQQQQKTDDRQSSSPTVDPTPAEAHSTVDITSEPDTALSAPSPPAAITTHVQFSEAPSSIPPLLETKNISPLAHVSERIAVKSSIKEVTSLPRLPSPVDPTLSASLISSDSRTHEHTQIDLPLRTSDASLPLSNVTTAPLDIISSSSLSSMNVLSTTLPITHSVGYVNSEQTPLTPPVHDLGIGNMFVNELNGSTHCKLSDIWGGTSGVTSSEPWSTQLMLNGFGTMNMGNQNTQPPVSTHSDWGAAAAADPMLSFNQMRQSPMSQQTPPANPYSGMEWIGKQQAAAQQPPMQQNMYQIQQQTQRQHASLPPMTTQPQRAQIRTHGLTDNCLFNLAAQLAASQSTPASTPSQTTTANQYYPSPSYTDPNALGMGPTTNNQQQKYQNSFQGAANEYESLTNILSSYSAPQGVQLGNGIGNQDYPYSRLPTSQSSRVPSSGYQFPPTVPPPGFGGQQSRSEISSALNTAVPPPGVPQMRSSPYYSSQMPPPHGTGNGQQHPNAFTGYNSSANWMNPGKPNGSNQINGVPSSQPPMQWGGGWN